MRAKEITLAEEVQLLELNMSPSSLRQLASGIDARAGMEFEMIVPSSVDTDNSDNAIEPDYDEDRPARSIGDIINFFSDGEHANSSRDLASLREQLYDEYQEWLDEQFHDKDYSDIGLHDVIHSNLDSSDVIDILNLDGDADVSADEYDDAIEKVIADQISPYFEDAYDEARDDWMQTNRESQWLRNNYPNMTDIEGSLDINWPYYTSDSATTDADISIEEIAQNFGRSIGRPVESSTRYHGAKRKPGIYVVEPDASLTPNNAKEETGLEFVSPPLPVAELLSDLHQVKAWADNFGCYTNSSTGLHINVSVPGTANGSLDYVKLALLLGDKHVSAQFGRETNTYAKSAIDMIVKRVNDAVSANELSVSALMDTMHSKLNVLASKIVNTANVGKFTSIHPKEGYIEFRSPGGDWLGENFDLIENTLLRFVVALDAACDPQKSRQEYLTKLYKLLQVKDSKDPLAYFAQYSAGEIPKQALKSFMRQARTTRANKPIASATQQPANTGGPITGDDAWVILVGDVPMGRVQGATQHAANEAARQWLSRRSREWLSDAQGQEVDVVHISSPHVQELLRQTGR